MHLGIVFPQTEIGPDPAAIRAYAQAVEEAGYHHLIIFDHVLGADPTHRPGWSGYNYRHQFHEPFVLFGYLAALTGLELVTSVLVLPQRQTALVAKQATEVDRLSGGKLRLGVGVGWNAVEFEALGQDFHQRGRLMDEQIAVLRLLWSQEVVSYQGAFHTITEAGLNPLPIGRTIPIWIGGHSEAALRRTATLGDGWMPMGKADAPARERLAQLRGYLQEAGRPADAIGIEPTIAWRDTPLDDLVQAAEDWRALGATHLSLNTMGAGFRSVDEHIAAIRRFIEAIQA